MRGLIFLFIGVAFFVPKTWADLDPNKFIVEKTIGAETWVKRPNAAEKVKLSTGESVSAKDVILTGAASHVVISLIDGSKVSIGPYTQYEILPATGKPAFWLWSFRLVIGTVRALVRKATNEAGVSTFQIQTERGTAGVRGTEFVVTFNTETQNMDVYTLDGKVYIAPPGGDENHVDAAIIDANRMRSIGKDGKPTKHRAFIRSEFLKNMDKNGFPKISLGSDTTKSLQPVTSAPTEHSKEPIQKKEATVDLGAKLVELAKAGNTSGVIALLNQGALVNYQNENGLSSLMAAAQSSSTLTMKALIDRGADANLLDTRGHTALSYAVRWGDLSGVVLLRTTNINIDLRSADGFLAEDYAKARGDKDVISFLAAWRSELKAMQPKKKSGKRKD